MAIAVIRLPTKPTNAGPFETEDDVSVFFTPFGEILLFGGGFDDSIDVNLGIPNSEDVKAWEARMCDTLRAAGAPADTFLAIIPEFDGDFWNKEWWRVDVFGPRGKDGPLMMRMRNDYDAPGGLVELGYVSSI